MCHKFGTCTNLEIRQKLRKSNYSNKLESDLLTQAKKIKKVT